MLCYYEKVYYFVSIKIHVYLHIGYLIFHEKCMHVCMNTHTLHIHILMTINLAW